MEGEAAAPREWLGEVDVDARILLFDHVGAGERRVGFVLAVGVGAAHVEHPVECPQEDIASN